MSAGPEPPARRRLRVLVVDDHPLWRDGVARDLRGAGLEVIGTAPDGASALAMAGGPAVAAGCRPEVVLLDLNLPDHSGPEVIRSLVSGENPPKVLVLSASGERQDLLEAITAGATGYLVKSATLEELVAAIASVAAGEPVFTPGLAALLLGEYHRLGGATARTGLLSPPELTAREAEILRLVAKGLTYPQIAAQLVVSLRTVQNHVQNTLTKLQLHNKAQLVRYAMEQGLD